MNQKEQEIQEEKAREVIGNLEAIKFVGIMPEITSPESTESTSINVPITKNGFGYLLLSNGKPCMVVPKSTSLRSLNLTPIQAKFILDGYLKIE